MAVRSAHGRRSGLLDSSLPHLKQVAHPWQPGANALLMQVLLVSQEE